MRTLVLALSAALLGCSSPPAPSPTTIAPAPAAVQPTLSTRVEAQLDGKTDFVLTPPDGIEAGGRKFTAQLESDRLKLFENGKVVVKVKRKDDGLEIEDGAGQRVLRLKSKGEGHLKFLDGQERLLYRTESATPPIAVLAENGASLGRLELAGFTDGQGSRRGSLKGSERIEAAYALPLTTLKPEERAAMTYFLLNGAP